MQRVLTQDLASNVRTAISLFPIEAQRLIQCDVFQGDPVFAGVHGITTSNDKRSYRDTAHCCYPWHTKDKRTTVVVPDPKKLPVEHLVHEFAHALDYSLGFKVKVRPVTAYASTNRAEAFAEWITSLVEPSYLPWGNELSLRELHKPDPNIHTVRQLLSA